MSSSVAGPSKSKKKPSTKKTTTQKSKPVVEEEEPETVVSSEPKYEGTNLGWAYEPPKGAVLANHVDADAEEFDYEALKGDENLELWIVRVPDEVRLFWYSTRGREC